MEERISLFAPISAVPREGSGDPTWLLEGAVVPGAGDRRGAHHSPGTAAGQRATATGAPPTTGGPAGSKRNACAGPTPRRRLIARHTGLTHAGVNALNRITGVKKISEATVEQLQRRPDKADTWLRQASGRRVG